jgi:multisubunit Na+/H+ antiporter MnhB subunit
MRKTAAVIDLVMVLVFVAIGRSVHDHGVRLVGMISTAWPFVIGLGVGWLMLIARRRPGTALTDGVTVTLATVAVGMVLRVVSGQGTAFAFIAVAICFLGLFMVGWRVLVATWRRRRVRS